MITVESDTPCTKLRNVHLECASKFRQRYALFIAKIGWIRCHGCAKRCNQKGAQPPILAHLKITSTYILAMRVTNCTVLTEV